jgi:hypothetical protein
MTEGQKTYDSVDMKSKIVTRVHKVIWPCAKYPDYRGISGQFVYGIRDGPSSVGDENDQWMDKHDSAQKSQSFWKLQSTPIRRGLAVRGAKKVGGGTSTIFGGPPT